MGYGSKLNYADNDLLQMEKKVGNVDYANNGSLQEQVNELSAELNPSALIDKVYPVGSIYMSVNNVNPSALFGGTWVSWGAGRVPIGVNTGDSDFNTVEKTGGGKTFNNSHTHVVGSHTHTLNNHTHTAGAHTHTLNNHTHTAGAHTHTLNSHTHYVNAHTHIGTFGVDETHYYTHATYGSTVVTNASQGWAFNGTQSAKASQVRLSTTSSAGGGNTGGPSNNNTGSGGNVATGGPSNNNTGSGGNVATGGPSNNYTSYSGDITTTGGGSSAQSVIQPYITCYMWKRTA